MNVPYRSVREWVCPACGGMNYTPERDIAEDGVAVCWKCTSEDENFEEEVE